MLHWSLSFVGLLATRTIMQTPSNYDVILDDQRTMADKAFYIPGLEKELGAQWNKVTPAFRIMARRDLYPLGIGLNATHLQEAVWQFDFGPLVHDKRARIAAMSNAMSGQMQHMPGYGAFWLSDCSPLIWFDLIWFSWDSLYWGGVNSQAWLLFGISLLRLLTEHF